MNRKLVLISLTAITVLTVEVAFVALGPFRADLSSAASPNQKYQVEISQKRILGFERFVYLSAYRNGGQFVRNKLIYTGDSLDNDFRDLYPHYSWPSESILKLGRKADETQSNGLRIRNLSPHRINYLLIETYLDKYVLFDVEPQANVNLKFQFLGQLSCQGEFAESKERFGSAVRLVNDSEEEVVGDFSIRLTGENALIESPSLSLKPVTCCAVDRPDINNEKF